MRTLLRRRFPGSSLYWERRYRGGGNSGAGSYGEEAAYKADFLNRLVLGGGFESVIEFGSGDGNQLALANYPRYLGLDVSASAITMCLDQFADDGSKSFALYRSGLFADPAGFVRADVALSLDVIFHLIEDSVFDLYMRDLFGAARQRVAIYGVDGDVFDPAPHVRHRQFSDWIEANTEWRLIERVERPRPDFKEFFIYAR